MDNHGGDGADAAEREVESVEYQLLRAYCAKRTGQRALGYRGAAHGQVGYGRVRHEGLVNRGPLPSKHGPLPSKHGLLPSKHGLLPSKHGLLPSLQGPLPSLQGPLPSPQGPLPSPQGPLPSPQGPLPSLQAGPLPSPQDPLPSPQGPLPSPQGPLPSLQAGPLPSPQGPLPSLQGPLPSLLAGPLPSPQPVATKRMRPALPHADPSEGSIVNGVVTRLADIADSVQTFDEGIETDGAESQEDVVQKLVELLKKSGDDLNEQIKKNKILKQQLQSAFSYALFEEVTSSAIQNMAGLVHATRRRSATASEEERLHREQIAWAFEVTSRLSSMDIIPRRRALSFGERYVRMHHSAWVEQHGGWENVFDDEDID